MRTPFIAGNWKMNLDVEASRALAVQLKERCAGIEGVEMMVAPAATSLAAVIEVLAGTAIGVGAQNCHWEVEGAYTGEVSCEMIRALGCSHVIIGHSERRQYFGETDRSVNRKLHAAHRAGLAPVVCLGETLEQREAGKTMEVVSTQLRGALEGVAPDALRKTTIAYEPVWAIGTGKTATSAQAQQVHGHLRGLLREMHADDVAGAVRIQYGGSVKPGNVRELMAQPDIDGALVGGASLKADSFEGILDFRS